MQIRAMQKNAIAVKLTQCFTCDFATLTGIIRLFHGWIWMCWPCHNNTKTVNKKPICYLLYFYHKI